MTLKIKQKITIMTLVFILNAIIISMLIGCIMISNSSQNKVNTIINTSVSDIASKLDSWVDNKTSKIKDLSQYYKFP